MIAGWLTCANQTTAVREGTQLPPPVPRVRSVASSFARLVALALLDIELPLQAESIKTAATIRNRSCWLCVTVTQAVPILLQSTLLPTRQQPTTFDCQRHTFSLTCLSQRRPIWSLVPSFSRVMRVSANHARSFRF